MVCGSLTSRTLPAGGVSFTNTGGVPEDASKLTVFIKNCKKKNDNNNNKDLTSKRETFKPFSIKLHNLNHSPFIEIILKKDLTFLISQIEGFFMLACSGTIEIGSFGVYSLFPMMIFVLGKSSMDKATAYIPFSVWVALNVIVHVSLNRFIPIFILCYR